MAKIALALVHSHILAAKLDCYPVADSQADSPEGRILREGSSEGEDSGVGSFEEGSIAGGEVPKSEAVDNLETVANKAVRFDRKLGNPVDSGLVLGLVDHRRKKRLLENSSSTGLPVC